MDRRYYSPMRLTMFLPIVSLVLGIGFALAQTHSGQPPANTPKSAVQAQEAAQPSPDTPASAAEKPAETPDAPAAAAEAPATADAAAADDVAATRTVSRMRSTTQAMRKAAAKKLAERRAMAVKAGIQQPAASLRCGHTGGAAIGQTCAPDYFTFTPNFANSALPPTGFFDYTTGSPVAVTNTHTGIRKFIDGLPGLGPANYSKSAIGGTDLGTFIPVASKLTNPWASAQGAYAGDYYEIGLKEYHQKMHSDLPTGSGGTQLRGYYDKNQTPLAAFGNSSDSTPHYLGPIIIATKGTPVRVKFSNEIASSAGVEVAPNGSGNRPIYFIPSDYSYMGMSNQPLGSTEPQTPNNWTWYSVNRATLHLHGGATPWISDGTPHQWTVPQTEYATANFKRGVSTQFVPDMFFSSTDPYGAVQAGASGATNDPGPGNMTFYWTNDQSGRLMFYHDHSWGTTRLNVYAGEAAGYLLHDPAVDALIGTSGSTKLGLPDNAGVDATGTTALTAAGLNVPGGLYHYGIPLVIQDKTFVPPDDQLTLEDPTWNWGPAGNLWFPHVYMTNQNPNDTSGASIAGRWDYGTWFWPPMTSSTLAHMPAPGNCQGAGDQALPWPSLPIYSGAGSTYANNATCPATPNPSGVPEAFMDTPVINGVAYPTVTLHPEAYRFQILNAANDRMFNMSFFYAADQYGNICNPAAVGVNYNYSGALQSTVPAASACTEVKMVPAVPHNAAPVSQATTTLAAAITDTTGTSVTVTSGAGIAIGNAIRIDSEVMLVVAGGGTTTLTVTRGQGGTTAATHLINATVTVTELADADDSLPACGSQDTYRGAGYLAMVNPTYVFSVSGMPPNCWPSSWPTDGRDGGVPDPRGAGPYWVQIGTEGGTLPAPVLIPATPIGYNYNRRDVVVTNVQEHALFLGPAERADVVVNFSGVTPGSTLILYNDSPAPVPGYDTRLDYYTGDPDQGTTGGAPSTLPGYGPNIRTMMQIQIASNSGTASSGYDLTALNNAMPALFRTNQPAIIVPEKDYKDPANGTTRAAFPAAALVSGSSPALPNQNSYARIQNMQLTYQPINGAGTGYDAAITLDLKPKAIHELFESDYGKMNSILAEEVPLTNYNNQTTIPLAFVDPPTDFVANGETQLWKVTHNGVDSHAIHFHLFNVQLINRVGWDGALRPPDPNEVGWKETVRMNPLEDAFVALKPVKMNLPTLNFGIPSSSRLYDPSRAAGATNTAGLPGFTNVDPNNNPITVVNAVSDFGWEYVWHCHLLGHEESDMMRPIVFQVLTPAPVLNLRGTVNGSPGSQTVTLSWSYISNGTSPGSFKIQRSTNGGPWVTISTTVSSSAVSYLDSAPPPGALSYQVFAVLGNSLSSPAVTSVTVRGGISPPTNVRVTKITGQVIISWTASTTPGVNGYVVQRSTTPAATAAAVSAWTTIPPTTPATNIRVSTSGWTATTTGNYYWFQVQAVGSSGTSVFAQSAAGTTIP